MVSSGIKVRFRLQRAEVRNIGAFIVAAIVMSPGLTMPERFTEK